MTAILFPLLQVTPEKRSCPHPPHSHVEMPLGLVKQNSRRLQHGQGSRGSRGSLCSRSGLGTCPLLLVDEAADGLDGVLLVLVVPAEPILPGGVLGLVRNPTSEEGLWHHALLQVGDHLQRVGDVPHPIAQVRSQSQASDLHDTSPSVRSTSLTRSTRGTARS